MNPETIWSLLQNVLSQTDLPVDNAAFLRDQRRRYTSENCLVIQPDSVEKIQAVVKICAEHRIPITLQGGNTGLVGGSVAKSGVLLNLQKLNKIREINLADNTITVDAGCILQTIQAAAQEKGRFFPLSLASEGSCQIGGNIACNAGGLNVLRYGTMRDLVLGLEVVLPNGELVSHLQPLHKNTTGYELKHLFIGSEGTLGIITAATLKLFAPAACVSTAWVGVENITQAIELLRKVRNHFAERLCSFELISQTALKLSSEYSQLSPPVQAAWHVLIELTDSLARDDLDDLLADYLYQNQYENSVLAQSEQERKDLWLLRENISASQRHLGASIKHDIAVPIIQMADFLAECSEKLQTRYPEMTLVVFGHLGDGSLHYNCFMPILDNQVYDFEDEINKMVYESVLAHHGTIAAEHGIGSLKAHWLPQVRTPAEISVMRAIKAQLDPHDLFNPNVLLPS